MKHLISIDPGKKSIAWAYLRNGILVDCGLLQHHNPVALGTKMEETIDLKDIKPDHVVIEKPQIYQQKHWVGDPNDLIDVAIAGGVAANAIDCPSTEFILPREWKGQTPKDISNKRTLKQLTDIERQIFDSIAIRGSLRHNVIDAIGIGVWRLKRKWNDEPT